MFRTLILITLIALPGFQSGSASANGCGVEVPCAIGERHYHARIPDGWNGSSALPVLIHFHGWGRRGRHVMNNGRVSGATRKTGFLLLAPTGLGRTWNFYGPDSPDIPFTDQVIEDAAKRWPIDRSRVYVSGYSWGGSMAWRYVCARGEKVAAMLSIAGTLYDQSEECAAPVDVRHVHGLNDTVMDYPYGNNGAISGPVALWLLKNGCRLEARSSHRNQTTKLPFQRLEWDGCDSGKSIKLDIHQRGHFIPRGWLLTQLNELN